MHLKRMIRPLLAALALSACATAHEPASPVGRLYHYVRSNQDGSLPEQIYQYRASATRLEVGKMVSNCTNAAFVTAELDLARGQPRELVGGRLGRDLNQEPFAWLTYDAATRDLHARIPQANIDTRVAVEGEPWIIYDFDLSELNARLAGRAAPREDFRFAVALIWPEEGAASPFRNLGWAEARFVEVEQRRDRAQARYEVSGGLNGELWLDPQGHVLEARFAEPNHTEYRDFHLVLQSVEHDGAASWREARAAHWRGCP
jgi:hypothetical protein